MGIPMDTHGYAHGYPWAPMGNWLFPMGKLFFKLSPFLGVKIVFLGTIGIGQFRMALIYVPTSFGTQSVNRYKVIEENVNFAHGCPWVKSVTNNFVTIFRKHC